MRLDQAPLARHAPHWRHPTSYAATQALGTAARGHIDVIAYASARDPEARRAYAVLEPRAFAEPTPLTAPHTWTAFADRGQVDWHHAGIRHQTYAYRSDGST